MKKNNQKIITLIKNVQLINKSKYINIIYYYIQNLK